ncbi:MAG: O-antigen ligase family protein [Patescibacteria group bacterium]
MKLNNFKLSLLRVSLTIFFFLMSLGQIQRLQITPQVAIYLHELVLAGIALVFTIELSSTWKNFFTKILREKSLLILTVFLGLQTLLFQIIHPDLLSVVYISRMILYAQLFFLIRLAVKDKVFTKTEVYGLLIWMSSLITLFGFIQYLLFPDTRWLILLGWDDHYYRLISTLFDPGFTGLVIASGLILYLRIFAQGKLKLLNILVCFLFTMATLLTYSRASYLSLAVVLIFTLITSKHKRLPFIILLLFACIPLLPRPSGAGVKLERTASISSRITSNKQALESLSLSEVIWGRGLYRNIVQSNLNVPNHAVTPDNSLVFLFVSFGTIGIVLILTSIWELRPVFFSEPIRSIILLIGIHSLFNNSLFYIWSLAILATVFSVYGLKETVRST